MPLALLRRRLEYFDEHDTNIAHTMFWIVGTILRHLELPASSWSGNAVRWLKEAQGLHPF